MGLGVSIFLIAVGAILTWAVNASVSGLELETIGVILMVVGALGLVLSMIFWSSWGGFAGERRRTTYVEDGPRVLDASVSSLHTKRRPPGRLFRSGERQLEREGRAARPAPTRPDPAAHAADDLAADVEAEAGAADAAREVRVEAEELLEDPLVLGGRDAEPAVADGEADAPVTRRRARARRGRRSGEYLTAFSTRFTSTCRSPSASAATCGPAPARSARARCRPAGASPRPRATARAISVASVRPIETVAAPESSRLASRMSLTIRASRSDSPEITSSIPSSLVALEHDVVAPQRHRGAVDRGERRAQLVRDGRDEVALELLDGPLLGEVAERVDGALRELGGGEREPELAAGPVERERLLPRRRPVRAASAPSTSGARAPAITLSASPVMRSAAGFQSRTTPSRSTRKTPSPTNSSACAACARRCSSPTSRALSIATAARRASSCARSRSVLARSAGLAGAERQDARATGRVRRSERASASGCRCGSNVVGSTPRRSSSRGTPA